MIHFSDLRYRFAHKPKMALKMRIAMLQRHSLLRVKPLVATTAKPVGKKKGKINEMKGKEKIPTNFLQECKVNKTAAAV